MAIYSYIITRDFGFAPNPFYGMCTLATCKPVIRRTANIGDWIVGFGSGEKSSSFKNKVIFVMQVEKKITFDEYWDTPEYQCKKPVMNGSLKQNYGDNIYHTVNGKWVQEDSHHSYEDGKVNILNLERDTGSNNVLIGTKYWYFGKDAVKIPDELMAIVPNGRGDKKDTEHEKVLIKWVEKFEEKGFIGEPAQFSGGFQRYGGN